MFPGGGAKRPPNAPSPQNPGEAQEFHQRHGGQGWGLTGIDPIYWRSSQVAPPPNTHPTPAAKQLPLWHGGGAIWSSFGAQGNWGEQGRGAGPKMGFCTSLQMLLERGPPVTEGLYPKNPQRSPPFWQALPCPQTFELLGLFCFSKWHALLLLFNRVRNLVCLVLCVVRVCKHWQTAGFLCFTPHPPEYLLLLLLLFLNRRCKKIFIK